MNLNEYIAKLASTDSTPGGGSATSLTGVLGISLIEMAIGLTRGKKAFISYEEIYSIKLARLSELKNKLQNTMDEDARAFEEVMRLYRHKPSEDEIKSHQIALEKAFDRAGRVPLRGAEIMTEVLDIALDLSDKINAWVLSDLIGGVELVHGALKGIVLNVAINISSMNDEKLKSNLTEDLQKCLNKADAVYHKLMQVLYKNETFQILK